MPDISAIASAISAFKAAKDIGESMIGLRDAAAFQSKLMEFQSKILDANNAAFSAQEERSTLLERIRNLEKELAKLENWEAEKQRYQLTNLGDDESPLLAYVLKPSMEHGETSHSICANCYANGKKSLLQAELRFPGRCNVLTCHQCDSDLYISGSPSPEHFKNRRR
ncbi:hypothetical protein ABIA85_003458 [Bradyrhizobium sp. LA6.10]|uniref:hypothetical protein n=1 Tax=Bradyrhizobium sp. LA6.10 TaxID=3156318 RepID=UPI003398EC44